MKQLAEPVAKFSRQPIIQDWIDRVVRVEEDACDYVNDPIGSVGHILSKAIGVPEEHEYKIPNLQREQTNIKNNDHIHEHCDQLLPGLYVTLQVVVYLQRILFRVGFVRVEKYLELRRLVSMFAFGFDQVHVNVVGGASVARFYLAVCGDQNHVGLFQMLRYAHVHAEKEYANNQVDNNGHKY